MENNKIFLNSFNSIEDYFKEISHLSHRTTFSSLLNNLSDRNRIVRRYKKELDTLRELRNFIVHGDISTPLLNVSDATVERIKKIEEDLMSPKKIREVFSKSVVALDEHDSLEKALILIRDKKYSQFPVINGDGFNGLVTENGITNWLANNLEEDIISLQETCISDVMINDEEVNSYKFLYTNDTLYDVIREFEKGRITHLRSFVIIVLNRRTNKVFVDDIYTILTPWDLNKIYKSLGLEN